jgi:predicted transcriptional regulator YheO
MIEKEFILDMLKRIADTTVSIFSINCEVLIYDLTDLKNSLIYCTGDISKRQPGEPVSDFILNKMKEEGDSIKDRLNYKSTLKNGRIFRSSTAFFRDTNGRAIAAICLNFDTTEFMNAVHFLENFVKFNEINNSINKDTFPSSVNDTVRTLVEEAIEEIGKQPPSMSTGERIQFVKILEQQGAFLIKGALDQIAIIMGLSKYTVYSYLQRIRASNALNAIV